MGQVRFPKTRDLRLGEAGLGGAARARGTPGYAKALVAGQYGLRVVQNDSSVAGPYLC